MLARTLTALDERLARRAWAAPVVLAIATIVVAPTVVVLPPDDEGLYTEVQSTVFRAMHLLGAYPLWDPFLGLGTPQPFSEGLTFHPILLAFRWLSPALSLSILYLGQMWIGALAVWAIARRLELRPWIALLCSAAWALSPPTETYLHDFWPSQYVGWTLAPLLLLAVIGLLDSERGPRRVAWAVGAGLCAGLILLNGHAGVVPYTALGVVAFLAGRAGRARELWPWLGLSLALAVLLSATKVHDIALEAGRGDAAHIQQGYPLDVWRLLLYPIHSPFGAVGGGIPADRLLTVGGPFLALAVAGLLARTRVRQRHADGLRVGVVVCFVAWFVNLPVISGTWYAREPFTLLAILLACLALQWLWEAFPRRRALLGALAGLELVALAAGFFSYWHADLVRAVDYLRGEVTPTLRSTMRDQPLYAYFQGLPDHRETRVYMAPGAEGRLYRSLDDLVHGGPVANTDYEFAGWGLHGLRLLNGHFKGVDLSELQPVPDQLQSDIRAEPTLPRDATALDALDVGYVLALPGEPVAPSLERIRAFTLRDGTTIVVYRNPAHWPDAAVLAPAADRLATLPARAGCAAPGLMCADFASVAALERRGAVSGARWDDLSLRVRLAPQRRPAVLMLSQLYRPGWQARLPGGHTVRGHRLFGGLTGFDLPAGTTSAQL
ncbi:MAG TPA: hypothetical protein VHB30_02235, partial [Solirubrobacteraceae bacterium]|nr:hypothetical protein [Solirubrobacteraceae bacterium]